MNLRILLLFLVCLLKYVSLKIAVNQQKCGSKLLDDMELVPDSAFSASSSYWRDGDRKMDFSPKAARESYDKDVQEFAWCPMNKVQLDLKEYLDIDLGRLVVINFAQTRGRFAQGAGKEFIPYYKIEYRREAAEKWRHYQKFDSARGLTDILKGPSDAFLDAYETLDPPIITRWIRIYPFSYTLTRVCMKLQLFGCTFESSVLEYRIPQGSEASKSFPTLPGIMSPYIKIFQDSSYDGLPDHGLLNGGLGRLTDNKSGENFISNPTELQYFVGWNIENIPESADKAVTLWFRFDSVRNFSHVRLNGYQNNTLKIVRPEKLEAKFSIHGTVFNDADTIDSSRSDHETNNEANLESQWIQFNLGHKIGQFLQLKLYFQSDWIILTEIEFISVKAIGYQSQKEITMPTNPTTKPESSFLPDNPQGHMNSSSVVDVVYVLTILLCVIVGLIMLIAVAWFIWRHKRIKRKKIETKKSELAYCSQNRFKTFSPPSAPQPSAQHMTDSFLRKYTPGSLQMAPRPPQVSQSSAMLFNAKMSPQNNINLPKQSIQNNENSVYTSIPGSDNDSSLSTDYMASSGANSSHPYTQTMPMTGSIVDYMTSQPQVIANPLVDLLDNQQFFTRGPNTGICSYDPEMFGAPNPVHVNSIPNIQSFAMGNTGYQPIQYNDVSLDRSFYPLGNTYQGSLMKNNHLLK